MDRSKKSWVRQESKKLFNFQHKTSFNIELQESNSMNQVNIICLHINSISINIYIYIYKQRPHVGKHEFLLSGTLYDILLIQASISSKSSIYVKLLSNGKCIYFNVLIKFKKFVYIYKFTCFELIQMDLKVMGNVEIKFKELVYINNFTCFELIRMDLKSHGKCMNQKNFSIFCIRLTSMQNCKSQIQ